MDFYLSSVLKWEEEVAMLIASVGFIKFSVPIFPCEWNLPYSGN